MPENAKYYLARVIKLGALNSAGLIDGIREPVQIRRGDFFYTFTDIVSSFAANEDSFVFARLTKYRPTGEVDVVVPERHVETSADVPNLVEASSPFVYLPAYSGLAYQHIWNKMQREQFERTFKELIEEKHQQFFANAEVEPVADLRTFVQQVSELTSIATIDATVHPPNPLFGPAWERLRSYLRDRNLKSLKVKEEANDQGGITTNITAMTQAMLAVGRDDQATFKRLVAESPPSVTDAAVIMAADGFGKARISGRKGKRFITVTTLDSQIGFTFAKDPDPRDLAREAAAVFSRISDERYLEHPR